MKIFAFTSAFMLACAAASAAVIAEWDFTKGYDSLDGKFKLKPQAAAQVKMADDNSGVLFIAPDGDKPAGLRADKTYKELSPKGAFEIAITFRPDMKCYKPHTKRQYSVLWDNKYYFATGKKDTRFNNGFMVRMSIGSGLIYPQIFLGTGTDTVSFNGTTTKVEPGKFYTIKIKVDPAVGVSFTWGSGKEVLRKFKPEQVGLKVANAHYPVTIGDRYSSTRAPFAGVISKVVLSTPDEQPAAAK